MPRLTLAQYQADAKAKLEILKSRQRNAIIDIDEFRTDIQAISSTMKGLVAYTTPGKQRAAAYKAAKPLEEAGRKRIPKSNRKYKGKRYNKTVEGGALPYQADYLPGNLKKSWRRLPASKLGRRTRSAFVGPIADKTEQGATYGRTIKTSHGIFANSSLTKIRGRGKRVKSLGGRQDFQRRVTLPAYKETALSILRALGTAQLDLWEKHLRKKGFKG